jgi:predicted flap endonuclease-1-like 5' DNA nuclease
MQESSTVAQGKIVELEGMHSRASLEAETRAGEIGALRAQLDTTREKLIALEASAAQPAPAVAMAAAAGFAGGSQASMPPVPPAAPAEADDRYEKLKARFDGFVIAQQREGYGDIERIEGIGPVFGQKLRATGIAWVKTLLEEGATAAGRKAIVAETGLDPKSVLDWVNAADLLRIEGMIPDWAELLEKSGVDTVKELRNRVPENLQKKMEATNPTGPRGRFSPTVPDVETVKRFIEIAKTLEPKVSH